MSAARKAAKIARASRPRTVGPARAVAVRERFPAIAAFADAYLNQDVHDVYGGPLAAADAFRADASATDLRRLRDEWTAFRSALPRGPSADRLARYRQAFAAGWAPTRFSQVAAVFARASAPSSGE